MRECHTAVLENQISKRSDSPPGEMTFALVPWYISLITDTIRFGMPYAARILSILPRCTFSNAVLKSMNVRTAGSFRPFTPSMIRCRTSIWCTVDLLGLNPF